MKLRLRLLAAWVGALACACSSPPTELQFVKGPDTGDGLRPVQPVPFQRVWVREGASFAGYEGLSETFSGIRYRRQPKGRPTLAARDSNNILPRDLNEALMYDLAEIFDSQVEQAEGWQLERGKGPGVLRARVAVVDLVLSQPVGQLGGEDQVWVDSVGAFTIVIDLYDSESGTLLARAAERRPIADEIPRPIRAVPGDTIFHSRRIFHRWAQSFTRLLDRLREVGVVPDAAQPGLPERSPEPRARLTRVAGAH